MLRKFVFAGLFLALSTAPHSTQEAHFFPALQSGSQSSILTIYSSLDLPQASPVIEDFLEIHPTLSIRYEEFLTTEIHDRVIMETDEGLKTADIVFSSAMDLQMKLANDGYGQALDLPSASEWPLWAKWQNTAFAITFEPAVFVYNEDIFEGIELPQTRGDLTDFLWTHRAMLMEKVGTYDIGTAGIGFLYFSRDLELYRDVWALVEAFGGVQAQTFSTTSVILDGIQTGELAFGYNILSSYALERAQEDDRIGIILPSDYAIAMSRVAIVPTAAANPDLGSLFMDYLMSDRGQALLKTTLYNGSVMPNFDDATPREILMADLGARLQPVPLGPGLLVYIDDLRREQILKRWRDHYEMGLNRPVEPDAAFRMHN